MPPKRNPRWPVLTSYDSEHLSRVALPLGGIGTGTVSLGGRGDLRDWEIVNRPAKGFTPDGSFFALYAKPAGGAAVARALEGPIDERDYEGDKGARAPNHGLPRFRNCSFHAAYPFGQVILSDPDVPLDARIEAFNPLIPPDADASGIPAAILRFVLTNKTSKTVAASVAGTAVNFIGMDGPSSGRPNKNVNEFRKADGPARIQGIFMKSEGVDPAAEQFGTMALATAARSGVTWRTTWRRLQWETDLLDWWDDFSGDGKLEDRIPEGSFRPGASPETMQARGSLAVSCRIPPRGSKSVTFLITWHFPNRQTWTPVRTRKETEGAGAPAAAGLECGCQGACADPNRVGNYYTTRYRDAWDAAVQTAAALPRLEKDTIAFVEAFCDSDLPHAVKEAALFNLSTLRSQTCFRTEDGRFYGWEGCFDAHGCCHGSCTHVWNYEQATAFLFGGLARIMREVEFAHATRDNGFMSFRVNLPVERAREMDTAAADGQMGCLMKLCRDWRLSGDEAMLRALWPKARKALEFCWVPGGWDADRDGVMEGCQHNTMDVEYYGPNPQMGVWYLGALRACEEMARAMGENDFAATCRALFERGRRWIDENLFNGEYYEHRVQPTDATRVAPGLRHPAQMGASNPADPDFQLGAGCLVDQLVGQYMAHVCGLGYLLDPAKVQTALRSILKYNHRKDFYGHFNQRRSFVLNDESALLMATYPLGRRPKKPFPYHTEVMTGFEYTAAVGMIYEGDAASGLKCIEAVRARYDGRKRSPFDEAECGHHYARAMASWAAVLALTGFQYSGVERSMTFAARDGLHFWSNGGAWGTCRQKRVKGGVTVELSVGHGTLMLARFSLTGAGTIEFKTPKTIRAGRAAGFTVPPTA